MSPRAPKLKFTDAADAAAQVGNFQNIRELNNESAAALKRLRDAFDEFYKAQLAADPLWDTELRDDERGLRMTRTEQSWGHYYAVRDMPNPMILFLAEHGGLQGNNAIIDALMGGDAPPQELIDIAKYRHGGSRNTYNIESTKGASE